MPTAYGARSRGGWSRASMPCRGGSPVVDPAPACGRGGTRGRHPHASPELVRLHPHAPPARQRRGQRLRVNDHGAPGLHRPLDRPGADVGPGPEGLPRRRRGDPLAVPPDALPVGPVRCGLSVGRRDVADPRFSERTSRRGSAAPVPETDFSGSAFFLATLGQLRLSVPCFGQGGKRSRHESDLSHCQQSTCATA